MAQVDSPGSDGSPKPLGSTRWAVTATTRLLASRPTRLGSTRLVAVDGPAGSGKSTFATAIANTLVDRGSTVRVLHLDDLYAGWTGLNAELETRLTRQVLQPLASGHPGRWQQYDWRAGIFDPWHTLPAPDVLVVEGCGSGAEAYAAYRSVLVWVHAPAKVRLARGWERDGVGEFYHWLAWMGREQRHFARNHTPDQADLTLRTG